MTPEGKIQEKITKHLKKEGWFVTKLMQTSTNGIPDVLAVKMNQTLFIEVKTEKGRLSPLQVARIKVLTETFHQWVLVAYGYEDFLTQYNKYKKANESN